MSNSLSVACMNNPKLTGVVCRITFLRSDCLACSVNNNSYEQSEIAEVVGMQNNMGAKSPLSVIRSSRVRLDGLSLMAGLSGKRLMIRLNAQYPVSYN